MKRHAILALAAVGMLTTSCGYGTNYVVNRAIDKTVDSAADKVGERIGEAIAADILANNPHLLNAYAMGVFNVLFYQGGYYLSTDQYAVGEWSTWRSEGTAEGSWFQKVLLRRHESGNEWWRVETQSTNDGGDKQTVIMEALFTPPEETTGARRVLRMRALLPDETEPSEIPITEQDSRSWYFTNSRKLTEESLDGMTVGEENIETPAGTFMSKHLRTQAYDKTYHDWWLNEAVPGQLVKFTRSNEDEKIYEVNLIDFGTEVTTSKLGVDLDKEVEAPDAADASEGAEDSGEEATDAE